MQNVLKYYCAKYDDCKSDKIIRHLPYYRHPKKDVYRIVYL